MKVPIHKLALPTLVLIARFHDTFSGATAVISMSNEPDNGIYAYLSSTEIHRSKQDHVQLQACGFAVCAFLRLIGVPQP